MSKKIQEKLSRIKLVAFDVDGVLTNGEIIYTDKGEEIKIFNAKDGQGMSLLRKEGLLTAIITARTSFIVEKRGKDLDIPIVYQGSKNKINSLDEILEKHNLDYSEVAYVGDDIPDICVLEKAGAAFCPADAIEEVKEICDFVSSKEGGKGAVREICNLILKYSSVNSSI